MDLRYRWSGKSSAWLSVSLSSTISRSSFVGQSAAGSARCHLQQYCIQMPSLVHRNCWKRHPEKRKQRRIGPDCFYGCAETRLVILSACYLFELAGLFAPLRELLKRRDCVADQHCFEPDISPHGCDGVVHHFRNRFASDVHRKTRNRHPRNGLGRRKV